MTAPASVTTIEGALFARKREVDGWPSLRGGQKFRYAARRNRSGTGILSALLCKACVVALKGDVTGVDLLEPRGDVAVRSRSQSGAGTHHCYLLGNDVHLPRGKVTYHFGLLFLAEALARPREAADLLEYGPKTEPDELYNQMLMHLADELYFWARYRDGDPESAPDRFEALTIRKAERGMLLPVAQALDPAVFTDFETFRVSLDGARPEAPAAGASDPADGAKFRGPQLAELEESLDLGMHCLLVGPTATGKSLCAFEAFERAGGGKPVFVIEGHESLREFDLLGGHVPDGAGGFAWRDGMLVRAMRAGGFLFVDEANRMPTRTLNVLLGVLSRGAVVLTEHGSEEVAAAEGFQAVMAMNLGQGYAVNALDRALLDRFACVLEFRYLPPREEEELLVAETGIDRTVARAMVRVAGETRRLRRNRELSGELTPRGLFAWARKFQARRGSALSRLQGSARVTWLHQVAGVDSDGYLQEDAASTLLSLIEAHAGR